MTAALRIASNLTLPVDAYVTGTAAILAQKRSGKSYTASVLAEDLIAADQQVVVLDPTGAWHGLRSSADGKVAGFLGHGSIAVAERHYIAPGTRAEVQRDRAMRVLAGGRS